MEFVFAVGWSRLWQVNDVPEHEGLRAKLISFLPVVEVV
jgi:hypothetical protein